MLQAAAEWRRRVELEESEEDPAAATVGPGEEIAAPPANIIEELGLIRQKLAASRYRSSSRADNDSE